MNSSSAARGRFDPTAIGDRGGSVVAIAADDVPDGALVMDGAPAIRGGADAAAATAAALVEGAPSLCPSHLVSSTMKKKAGLPDALGGGRGSVAR